MLFSMVASLLMNADLQAQVSASSHASVARAVHASIVGQQGRAPAKRPGAQNPRGRTQPPAGVVKRDSSEPPPLLGPIFSDSANALRDITEALLRAQRDNRRVLIHWGANNNEVCTRLHSLMLHDSAVRRVLHYEYDLVLVDVGSRDRNLDIALAYGVAPHASGIPWLTMLDSAGQPIANMHAGTFGDGRGGFDAAKLGEFLRGYQARYPAANAVLASALADARTQTKPLLVQFTSPACDRCTQLESWFSRSDVDSILSRNYARVRIDIERTIGGRDVLRRFSGSWQTAIPFFVLLDSRNGTLITHSSKHGQSDIAGLQTEQDITQFASILQTNAKLLTAQELQWLAKTLSELNVHHAATSAATATDTGEATRSSPRPAHALTPTGD